MLKAIIIYKDISVHFRETTHAHRSDYLGRTCPLCNQKIVGRDDVYLITNKYELFPNLYAHIRCATLEEKCVEQLINLYKESEMVRKKYKAWFEEPCRLM